MKNILLIEDQTEQQLLVGQTLSNHKIIMTDDPDRAHELLRQNQIDLILLDMGLSKKDGFSVLKDLASTNVPIICLASNKNISEVVAAFDFGAEDLIAKPFHPIELKARAEARLRKVRTIEDKNVVTLGPIEIHLDTHTVVSKRLLKEILLTQTEFKILNLMAKNPGDVHSREKLLTLIRSEEKVYDRAIDVHICAIRKKLDSHGIQFKAVPGIGYRLIVN
jgi:DNA-binding response OmpR family regulator